MVDIVSNQKTKNNTQPMSILYSKFSTKNLYFLIVH